MSRPKAALFVVAVFMVAAIAVIWAYQRGHADYAGWCAKNGPGPYMTGTVSAL